MAKCCISAADPRPGAALLLSSSTPLVCRRSRVMGLCRTSFLSSSTLSLVVALISRHWQPRGTCSMLSSSLPFSPGFHKGKRFNKACPSIEDWGLEVKTRHLASKTRDADDIGVGLEGGYLWCNLLQVLLVAWHGKDEIRLIQDKEGEPWPLGSSVRLEELRPEASGLQCLHPDEFLHCSNCFKAQ